MYYIDLNGEIIATFTNKAETAARLCFKTLHGLGIRRNAYGLHEVKDGADNLLLCSEDLWEAEYEAAHPELWD